MEKIDAFEFYPRWREWLHKVFVGMNNDSPRLDRLTILRDEVQRFLGVIDDNIRDEADDKLDAETRNTGNLFDVSMDDSVHNNDQCTRCWLRELGYTCDGSARDRCRLSPLHYWV